MGSSAQNRCRRRSGSTRFRRRFRRFQRRSGRLWCRDRSGSTGFRRRFRRRFREALVQRRVRFNRVPEKVPVKVREALVQSQVRFNRVPEKVPRGFGAEAGQVQHGSEEGSGEGLGGFGAEPSQVQQGSGEGSEGFVWKALVQSGQVQQGSGQGSRRRSGRLWCRARSGSTGFRSRFNRVPEKVPQKVWEALVQSQVRFNRVPEKVLEKLLGSLGEKPRQVQWVPGEGFGNFWCRARSGSNRLNRVSSAWLRSTLQKDQHASERFVRRKRCSCWGYHRSLFFCG